MWQSVKKRRTVTTCVNTGQGATTAPSPGHLSAAVSCVPWAERAEHIGPAAGCDCDRCVQCVGLIVVCLDDQYLTQGGIDASSRSPDGVAPHAHVAPLRCPLTLGPPVVPARLVGCTHLACFDCFTFLHQQLHRMTCYEFQDFTNGVFVPRWRCPCCGTEAAPHLAAACIAVDGWIMRCIAVEAPASGHATAPPAGLRVLSVGVTGTATLSSVVPAAPGRRIDACIVDDD